VIIAFTVQYRTIEQAVALRFHIVFLCQASCPKLAKDHTTEPAHLSG
jgi:hypothetical protein